MTVTTVTGSAESPMNKSLEAFMREKDIEQKIVSAVKRRGGICPKWVSPGFDGVPDRIAIFPMAKICFIEVKAPGKKPRPLQKARHKQLRHFGFRVYVIDSEEQIDAMLEEMGGGANEV